MCYNMNKCVHMKKLLLVLVGVCCGICFYIPFHDFVLLYLADTQDRKANQYEIILVNTTNTTTQAMAATAMKECMTQSTCYREKLIYFRSTER